MKVLWDNKGKKFFVNDISKDFHMSHGMIKAEDLQSNETEVKTNTGKILFMSDANFMDLFGKIKRQAQIITPKDIGLILAYTSIGKDSKIVDAGGGSGSLACFLAHIAKSVVTYEINEAHVKVIEKNKEFLKLKNLKVKQGDAYKGFSEKDIDVVTLDLKEPWDALENAKKALKKGGFIAVYCPQITQSKKVVAKSAELKLMHIKTIECIERGWDLEAEKARPNFSGLGHTGFLTFLRKL